MNVPHLVFFFAAACLVVYGTVTVLDSVSSDYVGALSYSTSVVSNDTFINTSGDNQYFYLDHISTEAGASILLTYEGGNVSDRVYVNGNLIGNLTPPSPDTIAFDVAYIELDTNVTYDFAAAVGETNITEANISYQEFAGCNYSYEACKNMNTMNGLFEVGVFLESWLPILALMLLLFGSLRVFLR